jgi:hypothetical protein
MRLSRIYLVLIVAVLVVGVALAAGCSSEPTSATPAIPEPVNLPGETQAVSVFFATGRTLVEEPRIVDATDVYRATLAELLEAAPEKNAKIAIVQPEAEMKSVTVEDGHAIIDWSPAILDFEAEDSEKTLAFAAFLMTLGQFPEIEKVSFTVEGKTEGEIDGKDIARFWGRVTLKNQPWDVLRPPVQEEEEAALPGDSTTDETEAGEGETGAEGASEGVTDDPPAATDDSSSE